MPEFIWNVPKKVLSFSHFRVEPQEGKREKKKKKEGRAGRTRIWGKKRVEPDQVNFHVKFDELSRLNWSFFNENFRVLRLNRGSGS